MINQPQIEWFPAVPGLTPPMPADSSALGQIPAAALQYCEALRSASGFGWYLFPALDLRLRWNGSKILIEETGTWIPIQDHQQTSFNNSWSECAGRQLQRPPPRLASELFIPGILQIWSGYFCRTSQDWSLLIRPIPNTCVNTDFMTYEGIVETDWHAPAPVFINVRLIATDHDIIISRTSPLFAVQLVHRSSYSQHSIHTKIASPPSATEPSAWDSTVKNGIRDTLRGISLHRPSQIGRYASMVRKRRAYAT